MLSPPALLIRLRFRFDVTLLDSPDELDDAGFFALLNCDKSMVFPVAFGPESLA